MKNTVPSSPPEVQPRQRFTAKPKGAWLNLVGRERDDAAFRDAVSRGQEWREKMNREGK
ncbi:MAG TPA: hypothetical protein VGE39_09165 [Prosthecobacter sp.]